MFLHSVLALESLKAYIGYLPLATAVLCAALLTVAFFIGFVKGGARVRWGGFAWLVASLGFVFANKYLHTKNPVYKMLDNRGFDARVTAFASSLTIALACILVVLLFYGVFALIFRRKRRPKERSDKLVLERSIKYGSYEGFDVDEDELRGNRKKPTGLGRLTGGIVCLSNTAMVLATLLCIALFVIDSTSLKRGAMAAIYTVPVIPKVIPYAARYALDFAIIGIVFAVAVAGSKKGFTKTIRVFIVCLGGLSAIVLAFYLPFSRFAGSVGFLQVIVMRCVSLVSKLGVSERVYTIGGKLVAALLLCAIAIAAVILLNLLLKKLINSVSRGGFFRVLDRVLAGLAFLLLGVALCALVWAVLYVFAYYDVFYMGGFTRGDSTISRGFFETFDVYLKPWLVRIGARIKSIF